MLNVSKSGATPADMLSFDCALFEQTPGAKEDAGATFSGTTTALTAAQAALAAKTITRLTLAIPAGTFTAAPGRLTLSVKPTNGSLGTDDAFLSGCWIEF